MMDFSQVTEVRIPQGDVSRITETSSGRVLWEKGKVYANARSFMYIQRGHKATSFIEYYAQTKGYSIYGSSDSRLTIVSNLVMGSAAVYVPGSSSSYQVVSINEVMAGDTLTACYVRKESEEANIPTSAQKMTDAEWRMTNLSLYAMQTTGLAMQGYYLGPLYNDSKGRYNLKVTVSPPITLSSSTGATTQITKITDISSYKGVYEGYRGYSGYLEKAEAPYLYGSFQLSCTSSNFNRMVGGATSPANDNIVTIFFTILR